VTRYGRILILILVIVLVAQIGLDLFTQTREPASSGRSADRFPRIRPDYVNVVLPPNIAPTNFVIDEEGTRFHVRISGAEGRGIGVRSRRPSIRIPEGAWRRLLDENRGRSIRVDVSVRDRGGEWIFFRPIFNRVAAEPVDRYLSYRLINSVYFWYNHRPEMCLYLRDVEGFEERRILHNYSLRSNRCVNCHTCAAYRTETMAVQLRGEPGPAMVTLRDGRIAEVDLRGRAKNGLVSFISIHPQGRLAAFAALRLGFFSKCTGEAREVFEFASDLGLYRFDTGAFSIPKAIATEEYVETLPAWSGDGSHLYFCRTKPQWPADAPREGLPSNYRDVRYDLMRIPYDAEKDKWGQVETVLTAKETGKSIAQPSVSPDGRWVVFCMQDYGMWPLVRPDSDLYLLDVKMRAYHRLSCSSDAAEASHEWSSNGRWIVFASKRKDKVFTRLYLAYIGPDGRSAKAVELPQRDPAAHERLLRVYNLPRLLTEPMPFTEEDLACAIDAASAGEEAQPAGERRRQNAH